MVIMKTSFFATVFLAAFLVSGCQGDAAENEPAETNQETTDESTETEMDSETEANRVEEEQEASEKLDEENPQTDEQAVKEKAETILTALKEQDGEELASHVHNEKGLLFSPYVYVETDAITLKQDQLRTLFEAEETYTWGYQHGSGKPIELTAREYIEEYGYDAAYESADEVVMNPTEPRGNAKRNVKEIFPDAEVVEYYVKGTEENGNMDWKALNLVFEKNEAGEWKLVALVHDQWTI